MVFAEFIPRDQEVFTASVFTVANGRAPPATFENGIRNLQSVRFLFEDDRAAVPLVIGWIAIQGFGAKLNATDRRVVGCREDDVSTIVVTPEVDPTQLCVADGHV